MGIEQSVRQPRGPHRLEELLAIDPGRRQLRPLPPGRAADKAGLERVGEEAQPVAFFLDEDIGMLAQAPGQDARAERGEPTTKTGSHCRTAGARLASKAPAR